MSRSGLLPPRAFLRLRRLLDRSAIGLLMGLSAAAIVAGKLDLRLVDVLGSRLVDLEVAVLTALHGPAAFVDQSLDEVALHLAVHEENARLRAEIVRLREAEGEGARLAVENRALRRMLGVPAGDPAETRLTARVVGDSGGGFVKAVLVDAGRRDGVVAGMAATTPDGLAGRVVDVGERSARILLLTDTNAKIPVVVARSGDQAILEGDNSATPVLRFLPLDPGFAPGDPVQTSGRGGVLPAGIPVGRIEAGGQGEIRVRPAVDWARLDYVELRALPSLPEPAPGS